MLNQQEADDQGILDKIKGIFGNSFYLPANLF